MNLNKKIGVLLDNGFEPKFISSLTESKINFLFEKMSKRKENKEQVTQVPSKPSFKVGDKGGTLPPNEKGYAIKKNTDNTVTATPMESEMKEGDVNEKFESKAQQGLFWARCNKCEDKNCDWCKKAKEFSKSTSEKQYKTMPGKKHPEKTVKYKKKETNEEFTMANYYDKVASVYANNAMGKTIDSLTKEQIINKHLTKIVESNLKPTMKKRDLLRLIESENKNKKNLNEDFYYGEMGEDFDMMSRYEGEPNWYEEDEEDYEEYDIPPGREEPGMPPGREDDDTPRPRNKMSSLSRRMNDPFAPTIEPGIKEPKIKPREPDVEPEWTPDEYEPENPDEDEETKIQGKRNMEFMLEIRNKFNRTMNRLNETHYKPIKYNKY